MPGPFMLQALVSGFGTGAKEAAFLEQRGPEKGQRDVVSTFPALLILLRKSLFCPRRMATTKQKSAGRK